MGHSWVIGGELHLKHFLGNLANSCRGCGVRPHNIPDMPRKAQKCGERPRDAQRYPEMPKETHRGPDRPCEAQSGPERPREAQRCPERPSEAQRRPGRLREAQRCPERPRTREALPRSGEAQKGFTISNDGYSTLVAGEACTLILRAVGLQLFGRRDAQSTCFISRLIISQVKHKCGMQGTTIQTQLRCG